MTDLSKLRVLLADDSTADAEIAVLALERAGITVDCDIVATPAAFKERLRTGTWDVILSDYRMPGWTGLDALRMVQESGLDTPLILVTGTLGEETAVDCVKEGIADYVLKANLTRLAHCVKRAIADVAARRDQRLAEQRLRESESRYRVLMEASFDGIYTAVDGVIESANTGLADMFGYELAEVIGKPIADFVAEEARDMVRERLLTGAEGTSEFPGLRKDGATITVEVTGRNSIVNGRAGRVVALRDVTARRTLEGQFRQAQKMEAVGRLAGGVAHDFNNLLTIITSYASMMVEDLAPDSPHTADLTAILQAADGAASLTRQLLAFSRQQVIEPKLVRVDAVIEHLEKMLRRLIGEDVDFVCEPSDEPCSTMIDPGQLEQVLMNLAINARDAMPSGGALTLSVSTANLGAAGISTQWRAVPGPYVVIELRDTGMGMDHYTQAHMFDPFFTTKDAGKGTGLGLSVVYGIVHQARGMIAVESAMGRGTTFRILLPQADEGPAQSAAGRKLDALRANGETILFVEDSPAVHTVVRGILERYGYRVVSTTSSVEALRIITANEFAFDLLLTDLIMPEINGKLLADEVRNTHPDARVMFISGYTDDAPLRLEVQRESVPYIQKPFTPEQLARKVREALS